MNEALTRVLATLTDPSAGPAIDDVETLTREYPFFVLPAVLALRHRSQEISEPLRQKLMNIIALNSPDPQAMFMLADVAYEDWAQFYPAASTGVTTNDAITKFLETYGHTDPREEALLERLIFNPAPDYSTLLAREQEQDMPEAPADPADNSQDALINSFIIKHKDNESDLLPTAPSTHEEEPGPQTEATEAATTPVATAPTPAPAPMHDTSLSESLAKIYIRQKRYDKAFEIIHTLSLNNPKKSAYFADQLRFLRKLILNRDSANNSK